MIPAAPVPPLARRAVPGSAPAPGPVVLRAVVPSPVGALEAAATARGVRRLEPAAPGAAAAPPPPGPLAEALETARRMLAGEPLAWDGALDPLGDALERAVWDEVRRVPWGRTTTYGAIARRLGVAPREVGAALGANRLFLLVPCHRVVAADGSPRGFRWGLALKARLLALESGQRALLPP
uniref:Methylated-DNA--[protein]-cysteine S-methyltransferase n=1 Tax=Eiseniibacteriota bacterium TaxID=2212470 RepID=A0A832MKN0_UNCEI